MHRRAAAAAIAAVALAAPCAARAGGPFERIVAVGAHGRWTVVHLRPSGPRSEDALAGPPARPPEAGYLRLYPFVGRLPAIPGRFYPRAGVVCFSWRPPPGSCSRLRRAGRLLLARLARLPLRHGEPTTVVAVRRGRRLLRYADGNIFAALELALERAPVPHRSPVPRGGVQLTVTWRGPAAAARPRALMLTAHGVLADGRLYALPSGPWCYVVGHLRLAPSAACSVSR